MNKEAIEEYSDAVKAALKALTTEQRQGMYTERVGDMITDPARQVAALDEVICDNADCGSEESRDELYTLIHLLANKPLQPITICCDCGSDNVWVSVRINPNTGEIEDHDNQDRAGCYNCDDGPEEISQMLTGCGRCEECNDGLWCRELPNNPDDNDND